MERNIKIFLVILGILIFISIILYIILDPEPFKPTQKDKPASLLTGMGYYGEPVFTPCKTLAKDGCGYGKRKSIRSCIPHPETLKGCIDTDGYQTFNPIVENINCNFPCITDKMIIQGTKTFTSPVDKKTDINTEYIVGTNRLYDGFNGLDMTNYYIGDYNLQDQNFLLKGKCIPSELKKFYYKTYNCNKNTGVARGKKGCIYNCNSDTEVTRDLKKGQSVSQRSYPVENGIIVCRDKYNNNIYNGTYYPDKCYNTFEENSIDLVALGKVYGKYSYYDISSNIETYSLDLSDDVYVSRIGEDELCSVRSISDGTSGIKTLNEVIMTYGVSFNQGTVSVFDGTSTATNYIKSYDSVTINFSDNGTRFTTNDTISYSDGGSGLCVTYGYITNMDDTLVTSVLHGFYTEAGVCKVNVSFVEPNIFNNSGWDDYKLNYSKDFTDDTISDYGLSVLGFVTKGIRFGLKSYNNLEQDIFQTINTGVCYGETGTCSLYSQNCYGLHIYGTPVSKIQNFSDGTSSKTLDLDDYSGYYYPVSILESRKDSGNFLNFGNDIYDTELNLKEYPNLSFYISSSQPNSTRFYEGPIDNFEKNSAEKVLGTAEVKLTNYKIYGNNVPYSSEIVGRGYNCNSGINLVGLPINIGVSELYGTSYKVVEHIRGNDYLSKIDVTNLIPKGFSYNLNEVFDLYRSLSNRNYVISDKVNFVKKNITKVYDSDIMKGAYKIDNNGNRENICYNDKTNTVISTSKIVNYNPGEVLVVPYKSNDDLNINISSDGLLLDYFCSPEVDSNDISPNQKDTNIQFTEGCSVIDFGMSVDNGFLQLGYTLPEIGCKKGTKCFPTFYTNNKTKNSIYLEHQDVYEVKSKELYYRSLLNNTKLTDFDSSEWSPISEYNSFTYANTNSIRFKNNYNVTITKPGILISDPETYTIVKANNIKTSVRDNIINNPFKSEDPDFLYNFTYNKDTVKNRNKFDQIRYFLNEEKIADHSQDITTFYGNILPSSIIKSPPSTNSELDITHINIFNENYYYEQIIDLKIQFPTLQVKKEYSCNISVNDSIITLSITDSDDTLNTILTNRDKESTDVPHEPGTCINPVSLDQVLSLNNTQKQNEFFKNIWGIYSVSVQNYLNTRTITVDSTSELKPGMYVLSDYFSNGTSIVSINNGTSITLSNSGIYHFGPGDTIHFVSEDANTIGYSLIKEEYTFKQILKNKILNNIYDVDFSFSYDGITYYTSDNKSPPPGQEAGGTMSNKLIPFIIKRQIKSLNTLPNSNFFNLQFLNSQFTYLNNFYNVDLTCSFKDYFTNKNILTLDNYVKPNINFLSNIIYDLTIGRYIYSVAEYIPIETLSEPTFKFTSTMGFYEINSMKKDLITNWDKNPPYPLNLSIKKIGKYFYEEFGDNGISISPNWHDGNILDFKIISKQINQGNTLLFRKSGITEVEALTAIRSATLISIYSTLGGHYDGTNHLPSTEISNTNIYGLYSTKTDPTTGLPLNLPGSELEIEILEKDENNNIKNFRINNNGYGYDYNVKPLWYIPGSNKYLFQVLNVISQDVYQCKLVKDSGYTKSTLPPDYNYDFRIGYLGFDKIVLSNPNGEESLYFQTGGTPLSSLKLSGVHYELTFKTMKKSLKVGQNIFISKFKDTVFELETYVYVPSGRIFTEVDKFQDEFSLYYQTYNSLINDTETGWYAVPINSSYDGVNQNISSVALSITYKEPTFEVDSQNLKFTCDEYSMKSMIPNENMIKGKVYAIQHISEYGTKTGRIVVDDMGPKIIIDKLSFDTSPITNLTLGQDEYNFFYSKDQIGNPVPVKPDTSKYISSYNSGNVNDNYNNGFLSGMLEDYKCNIRFEQNIENNGIVPLDKLYAPNIIDTESMVGLCALAINIDIPSYGVLIPPTLFTPLKNEMINLHDHIGFKPIASNLFEVVKVYDKDSNNIYMERNYFNTDNHIADYTFTNVSNTESYLYDSLNTDITSDVNVEAININQNGFLKIFNTDGTSLEVISYTGRTQSLDTLTLQGVSRGLFNSEKLFHNSGSCVQNVTVSHDYMFWDLTRYNLFDQKYKISDIKNDEIFFDIPFNNIPDETLNYLKDVYKGTLVVTEKENGDKFLSKGEYTSSDEGNYLIPNYTSFFDKSLDVSKSLKEDVTISDIEYQSNGLFLYFSDGTSVNDLGTSTTVYLNSYQSNNYGILNYDEEVDYIREDVIPPNSKNVYPLSSDKSSIGYVYEISTKNDGGSFNVNSGNILIKISEIYKIKVIEDEDNRLFIKGNNLSMTESRFYGTSSILMNVIDTHEDSYIVTSGTSQQTYFNFETTLSDVVLGDVQYDGTELSYSTNTTIGTSYIKFYPIVQLLYINSENLNFNNIIWSGGPYLEKGDTNSILDLNIYVQKSKYEDYKIYNSYDDYRFIYIEEDFATYDLDYGSKYINFDFNRNYHIGDYTKINFPEKKYLTYDGTCFSSIPKTYNLEDNSTSYYNPNFYYIEGIEIIGDDKKIYKSLKPNINIEKGYQNTEYWQERDMNKIGNRFYTSENGYMSFVLENTKMETLRGMKDIFLENESNLPIKVFDTSNDNKQFFPKMCINYDSSINYQNLENKLYIINLDATSSIGISPFLTLANSPCSYGTSNKKIGSFSNCLGNPNDLFNEQYISMFNYSFMKKDENICYNTQIEGISVYELANSLTFMFSSVSDIGPSFYKISSYFGYDYLGKITFIEYNEPSGTSLYPLVFSNYQNDLLFDKVVGIQRGNVGVCTKNYTKYEIFKLTDIGSSSYLIEGIPHNIITGSEQGVSVCIMSNINPSNDVSLSTTTKLSNIYIKEINSFNKLYPIGEDNDYFSNDMDNYKILRQNTTGHTSSNLNKDLVKCNYFFKYNRLLNDPLYVNRVNYKVTLEDALSFKIIDTSEDSEPSIEESKFPKNFNYIFDQSDSSNNSSILKIYFDGKEDTGGTYDPVSNSIIGTCVHYYINSREVFKEYYDDNFKGKNNVQPNSRYFSFNLTTNGVCVSKTNDGKSFYKLDITD